MIVEMKLTKTQLGILMHRLELADCIADCFSSELVGEPCYQEKYNEVECAAVGLCLRIRNTDKIPESLTPLEIEILVDCLDGSTFFADEKDSVERGEITKSQSAAACAAANSLGVIISRIAGYPVSCAIN